MDTTPLTAGYPVYTSYDTRTAIAIESEISESTFLSDETQSDDISESSFLSHQSDSIDISKPTDSTESPIRRWRAICAQEIDDCEEVFEYEENWMANCDKESNVEEEQDDIILPEKEEKMKIMKISILMKFQNNQT